VAVAASSTLPEIFVVSDDADAVQLATRLLGGAPYERVSGTRTDEFQSRRPLDRGTLVVYLSSGVASARIDAITSIAEHSPDADLVASMPDDATKAELRRALRAGVSGLILDDLVESALVAAVEAVRLGQLSVPASMRGHVAPKTLSFREKQVLALVGMGFTNRQIAHKLFLAESTVKTHMSSVFGKLDTRSRFEAAALLLDPDEGHGPALRAVAPDEVSGA